MKIFMIITLLALLLSSCTTNTKPINDFLTPANLKSQFFSIDPTKNNRIRTSYGSIIQIPAGAISSPQNKTVQIEIKEALTASQIIQAGLITESNGKPLQSAGMIYINATVNNNS